MVETGSIRTHGTDSFPPQVAGCLPQLLPTGRNGRGDLSLQGTQQGNDQGAQMAQPGSLLKAS